MVIQETGNVVEGPGFLLPLGQNMSYLYYKVKKEKRPINVLCHALWHQDELLAALIKPY